MTGAPGFENTIQPFFVDSLGLRGRLVRLGDAFESIVAPHAYPAAVAEIMGEALALACALASGLKFEGTFILQTRSDGPVDVMVAHVSNDGDIRGYARFDEAKLATSRATAPLPCLLGAGHLAFTVDQGPDTERYQGIAELIGPTLAASAHNYFERSEQLATAVELAARPSPGAGCAAGLIVQRLPWLDEDSDEAWRLAVALLGTIKRDELLDPGRAPARLLHRLYGIEGLRLGEPRPLRAACHCSRQRVGNMLASFPQAEIVALAEDGRVTVTCEFCKTTYPFTVAEVESLAPGSIPPSP